LSKIYRSTGERGCGFNDRWLRLLFFPQLPVWILTGEMVISHCFKSPPLDVLIHKTWQCGGSDRQRRRGGQRGRRGRGVFVVDLLEIINVIENITNF